MGKKHGSLTRAGKVRKQTPKVETLKKHIYLIEKLNF